MHENLIEHAVASSAPRRIEMREKEVKRRKKKRERERRRGVEQRRQKESPGIMATTLRSGLRAPKSRPVSMPRHRHSFERQCVMRVSPVLFGHGVASARLYHGRSETKLCRRPRRLVGLRRSRLRLQNYWLSLVVYLAYC